MKVELEPVNYPYFFTVAEADGNLASSSLDLPGLIFGNESCNGIDVIEKLKTLKNLDSDLAATAQIDAKVYASLVHNELQVLYDWMFYFHQPNYRWVTEKLLLKRLPSVATLFLLLPTLPINTLICAKRNNCHQRGLTAVEKATIFAQNIFSLLENRLQSPYFFGDQISSLDVACAAYVLVFRSSILPCSVIQDILRKFKKLNAHADIISAMFLHPIVAPEANEYYDVEHVQLLLEKEV